MAIPAKNLYESELREEVNNKTELLLALNNISKQGYAELEDLNIVSDHMPIFKELQERFGCNVTMLTDTIAGKEVTWEIVKDLAKDYFAKDFPKFGKEEK